MTQDKESNLFYQSRAYRETIDTAEGIYIYSKNGNRYLDASSGAMVSNIGHSNKNVIAAMKKQMDKATFSYRLHFNNEPSEDLASMTAEMAPEGLGKVFFVSGGSEAIESSIKLARQYAICIGEEKRWKVISRFPSYHGCTLGALALTGYSPLVDPFLPMMRTMPNIPAPTCYLDKDNLDDNAKGIKYADMLKDEIIKQGPETVLAFIMEPVGGASTGALVAPDSYYSRIKEICDEFGIMLIYDEVMTGAGRTGTFLACEHWGIVPDIICLSKGFAAGYSPLGAIVAKDTIVNKVLDSGGFLHGFTYAGNPLSCAAGLAVLKELKRQKLVENAKIMGDLLKSELTKLMDRYPFIGDVRGKGLLLAFEIVEDKETMKPFKKELNIFNRLVDIAYSHQLIIYSRRTRGGLEGDHFMVCPPLIINREQVFEIITSLSLSLDDLSKELNL